MFETPAVTRKGTHKLRGMLSLQVTDLGAVLHMVGGTAASFMIFFLPGMLLMNAAIVKESASQTDLAAQAWLKLMIDLCNSAGTAQPAVPPASQDAGHCWK